MAMVGVSLVLFAIMLGTAVNGFAQQRAATGRVASGLSLVRLAMETKFRTADLSAWQTGYAWDFTRGVPNAAMDNVGRRKQFVDSAAALRDAYVDLANSDLTAQDRQALAAAAEQFEKFMAIDGRVVAGYRAGTPAMVAKSNELASKESLEAFAAAKDSTEKLADLIGDRGQAISQAAARNADRQRNVAWAVGILGLLVGMVSAVVIVRSIAAPMHALRVRLVDIADGEGDLTARLVEAGRDELAVVAAAFNRFAARLADAMRAVDERANRIAAKSENLISVSVVLAGSARESAEAAGGAGESAADVSRNVQAMATGTEQMGASINEIAKSSSEAVRVTAEAVELSLRVGGAVEKLRVAGEQISEFAKVISGIAEQTNLLALNATIESARAGELGKGFAVVAGEVKELAQETARATEDISARIAAIQDGTSEAVGAIQQVTEVINRVNDLQAVIASAVDEQTATTAEIGRSITEAAAVSGRIAEDVGAVAGSAQTTSGRIADISTAADELAVVSGDLRAVVGRFRY
ncbi:methyl-accepting chemotaxis protein [Virgisporangium aliadipatigenens]|nr:methyl-accepting chemotaxis protein [Virgisporangium aliadipatigenens]